MNNRRKLVITLGASALTAPLCSVAQPQPTRTFRLGVLFAGARASSATYFRAFFESLASFGYVEGKNLIVERRFADGRIDRLSVLAAELMAAKVDVIYAPPTPAVLAVMKMSTTIPIVFSMVGDPIGAGGRHSRLTASDPLLPVDFLRSRRSQHYLITLSARTSIESGILMPRAFAVLTLTISSNLVGCSIGRSAGLAPFRILSTYVAARRAIENTSGP